MIIYLSLKQILLNQISILLRKQREKNNADPERIAKRLNYLQLALEQIKSYEHNTNYRYVLRHFNINLSDSEQQQIRKLSQNFDSDKHEKRPSKSGFTTQRSETLFMGASEDQFDTFLTDITDEKTPPKYNTNAHKTHTDTNNIHAPQQHPQQNTPPPRWVTYRGFANWLKKQSFIRFKKRNDQEKFRKIWSAIIGLQLVNLWERGKIKRKNIIGTYGDNQPYIAIHKCGTKDIVKATLLRLSMIQNRIFKFEIERESAMKSHKSRSRARRSIDMDNDNDNDENDDDDEEYDSKKLVKHYNASHLLQGQNLFNKVMNKDVLRIVATMLWDTNLANGVLEELLHNPRFSMYGDHAKTIANTIAKEMRLSYNDSVSPKPHSNGNGNEQNGNENGNEVEQFDLPSPQRPVSMQQAPQQFDIPSPQNNYGTMPNNNNSNKKRVQFDTKTMEQQQQQQNHSNNSDHARYYKQQQQQQQQSKLVTEQNVNANLNVNLKASSKSNSASTDESGQPTHRPHSSSVVFHDNIRESEIQDYGGDNGGFRPNISYDEEEDDEESGYNDDH